MVRGLDGFLFDAQWRCAVLKGTEEARALTGFRWLWRGGNTSSHSEQSS
jgi:hypothetical protein